MAEGHILSPEEVKEIRRKKAEKKIEHTSDKYTMKGSRVAINYETMGRFSIPSSLYFKDYDIEDINNLTFSSPDDLLENVLFILNKCKNDDALCSIGDMTSEEFLETLVGMKLQFNNGKEHKHMWLCDCQKNKLEGEQQVNETIIDLSNLNYIPIVEADRLLKDYYKEQFDSMMDEDWKNYLYTRYKNDPIDIESHTKEQEIETITIKEPIYQNIDGNIYAFRLLRMNDIIKGQRQAVKKFSGKIKTIQAKKVPTPELKIQRDEELKQVEREKEKFSILYAQAMTLLSVNGNEFPTDEERFMTYKSTPRRDLFDLIDFYDQFKFGINHEIELKCPLCGESIKRSLRQEINSIELLPMDSNTKRTPGESKSFKIFIGI